MTQRNRLSVTISKVVISTVAAALLGSTFGLSAAAAMPIASPVHAVVSMRTTVERVADLGGPPMPHRNVQQPVYPFKDGAAWDTIFGLADGAFNAAIIDQSRNQYYRQNYFYGGNSYTGVQFYGAPAYYGGPYFTYYVHE